MQWFSQLRGGLLGCSASATNSTSSAVPTPAIPVLYKIAGFKHKSIPIGRAAIQKLEQDNGIKVDTTASASAFTADNLKQYEAVVFLRTTQDVLNDAQQAAFEQYIRSGKGFAGIHAATDTEYGWPWYNQLVGAYFNSHPAIQPAIIRVTNKTHGATSFLPDAWPRTDEWYNFKDIQPTLTVLAILDESSYSGGTNGATPSIAWHHEFDCGRAFYTAGGYTSESYEEPLFLRHILGGIHYAIGKQNQASR